MRRIHLLFRPPWARTWLSIWPDALPRTILLFIALSLTVALLRSLVNLPGKVSLGDQSFELGASLPLYSLLAVVERGATAGITFLLLGWLIRPGKRSVVEWIVAVVITLPIMIQLARLSDGTSALLLLVVVLRRWLPVSIITGFVLLVLIAIAWLGSLPLGEWSFLGMSFSVTETASVEKILTASFLSASYIGFVLFALELALKLSKQRETLQQTLIYLKAAQEKEQRLLILEERTALSRELHDTIGHQMTALNLYAQRAELLAEQEHVSASLIESLIQVRQQGNQAVQGLTRAVSTLRDDSQDTSTNLSEEPFLLTRLTTLCQRWPGDVHLTTTGQDGRFADNITLTAYRVCQEALTNASKHAPGQELQLRIDIHPTVLRIEAVNPVLPEQLASASSKWLNPVISGYGLQGLEERAKQLGGTLKTSKHQGVFRLCLTIPLPPT